MQARPLAGSPNRCSVSALRMRTSARRLTLRSCVGYESITIHALAGTNGPNDVRSHMKLRLGAFLLSTGLGLSLSAVASAQAPARAASRQNAQGATAGAGQA